MRDIRETNWFWIDNTLIDREDKKCFYIWFS